MLQAQPPTKDCSNVPAISQHLFGSLLEVTDVREKAVPTLIPLFCSLFAAAHMRRKSFRKHPGNKAHIHAFCCRVTLHPEHLGDNRMNVHKRSATVAIDQLFFFCIMRVKTWLAVVDADLICNKVMSIFNGYVIDRI